MQLANKKCTPAYFLLALCSLFLMLCSCQNPLLPPKRGDSLPANTGSFSFTIGGNNARTILPSTPVLGDFAMYTLAFTAAGGGAVNLSADRSNTNLANPFVLAAGTYNLTVSAYKDAAKTQLMAQGTTSGIVITAGGNTAESVVLKPVITAGTGTYEWNITLGTTGINVSSATMTIKNSGGTQQGTAETLNTTGQTSGSRTLASGIYTVTFNFEGTESGIQKAVVFNETLYIYSELTSRFPSSGTYTFSNSHFHNTHWNITFDENYSGGNTTVQPVEHGGIYTAPTAPALKGLDFTGWNTAADGSGTSYSAGGTIPAITGNITLYAQWGNPQIEFAPQIAGGVTFTMGSPTTETGRTANREPQHSVTLTQSFYLSKYQVTQAQYEAVMGSNPSAFTSGADSGEIQGNRPVEKVSWYDAIVFCNTLSIQEGLTPAYSLNGSTDPTNWPAKPVDHAPCDWDYTICNWNANGYRLPTDAEWEYACRAGTTTAYNTGSNTITNDTGWYTDNSGGKTHEVGKKPANAFGLYDMHGNLFEWCWDWMSTSTGYIGTAEAQLDPKGPADRPSSTITCYVVGRGGSYSSANTAVRSAYRAQYNRRATDMPIGFRLARTTM